MNNLHVRLSWHSTAYPYGFTLVFLLLALGLVTSCGDKKSAKDQALEGTETDSAGTDARPHIVFVTGDEEYRSEESMPMLARLARRELDARVTVCYALDSAGYIAPNRTDHIEGLEALETADLMVIFTRFRTLPENERTYITDYVESGKPIVGFRTATHAFRYENDSTLLYWNDEWPTKVFGQQWITHHGHFDDGAHPLTQVTKIKGTDHPILNGFEPVQTYSWLYHVDGGDWKLYGDSDPLLQGTSLKSKHEMEGNLQKYPLTNPVAWAKSYTGSAGKKARVFFTTLGHPYDFKLPEMRRLALNGIFWALGREDAIPENGTNVSLDAPYEPNNSGFGEKYKLGQRPTQIN
ncbi:ThuA domain-containing protein [Flavobacteriaceae bacterium TP-CH-4]|uniref:ThuA domain-containing protein n=1 Tax=Pelagihabitans pacificus TaxID=2696054 RepID=A0A967AXX4_9FLAO|nr:ThuA domain-containing protein [Pelagihabitans pacificus]NHF61183.1 ThuA domain-containing protein [Pelagihabitans pacificus]